MRRLALLLVLVLSMGLMSAPPAAAYEPSGGAVFNTPPPWGTQQEAYRIIRHVEEAMRNVPARPTGEGGVPTAPQPEILITSYLMDRNPTVNSLIEACRRGASVRVIFDKKIISGAAERLISALNSDNRMDRNGDGDVVDPGDQPKTGPCGDGEPTPVPARKAEPVDPDNSEPLGEVVEELPDLTERQAVQSLQAGVDSQANWGADGSYVTQCKGSCRGGRGSMHTKFYAFSQTGTARNVIMVSSSNLNAGGAVKGWNDSYTMKGQSAAWPVYERIHDELGRDRRVANGYAEVKDGPFTSRFFPMANGTKANDPTLQDLRKVRCSSAFGRTRLFIAMFYWQGVRGNYIADRILQLARQGCRVSIILGAPSRDIAQRLRAAARAGTIRAWDSRHFTARREIKVRTHSKYVAIKGTVGANRRAHLVMAGSQNWGHGSLDKSDDNTVNIAKGSAYVQYVRNWNAVRKHSKRMG